MNKKIAAILLGLTTGLSVMTAPASAHEDFSIAFISRNTVADQKSYVNDALEGLRNFAEANELSEDAFAHLPAQDEANYVTLFEEAIQNDHDLIISLGSTTATSVDEFSQANPAAEFMIIDAAVDEDNVTSVVFKDYESAFLAGLTAALETESNNIGFIGGQEGNEVVANFERGFQAGAEEVNPDIEIQKSNIEGLDDIGGATEATLSMIENGADVIYHAAGDDASQGVFDGVRQIKEENPDHPIWIIGNNYDQSAEGEYVNASGEEENFILTSTVKFVGLAIEEFAQQAYDGELEPGIQEFGIADGAIDILAGQLENETYDTVEDYRQQIMDGELDVTELIDVEEPQPTETDN